MPANRFSIILPVRNGGTYVKECVHSILAQTYPHFNLLVLDNCSTDGTTEWINSLGDPRIVVYPAEKSLNIEQNWARILDVPKNEFMTCIGHDDVLLPGYLEEINSLIRKHPGASLYQTHFNFIDAKGDKIRNCLPMAGVEFAPVFLEKLLTRGIDVNGTGFMTRSRDYVIAGGIPPFPNLIFADFALWLDLTRMGYKATSLQNCFSYRLHQSMTATTSPERFSAAFEIFIGYLRALRDRDPSLGEVINDHAAAILSYYCRSFSHKLLRTPLSQRHGLTVANWIGKCNTYAQQLGLASFNGSALPGVQLAGAIDSNAIARGLFLLFKKLYAKPIWSDK
ncbi:MAG: glycosyltransferase family A protein [Chitinophagaceae bacterium]